MFVESWLGIVPADAAAVPLSSHDSPIGIGILLVFGALLVYAGWHQYRTKRLIQDTPTEKVRSMAVGRTELTGTALPREEPFDQPFADGEAVVAEYEIEEYVHDDEGGDWRTRDSGKFLAPFDLDDGTGAVRVDAADGLEVVYSDENTTRIKVGSNEAEPPAVKEFLEESSSLDVPDDGLAGSIFGNKRRYTQKVIPPGSDVYLFGNASEREDAAGTSNEEALSIGRDEATGRFVLSDMDEEALTSQMAKMAPLALAIGVAMLTGGFYFAVTTMGLVG